MSYGQALIRQHRDMDGVAVNIDRCAQILHGTWTFPAIADG
jgi:hypothetical protein